MILWFYETWSSVKSCLLPLTAMPTLPDTACPSCPQAQPWRVPAFQRILLVLPIKVRVAGSFAQSAEYHVQLPEKSWEANLFFPGQALESQQRDSKRICLLWELPLPPPPWQKIPKHTEGGNFQQGARPIAVIYFQAVSSGHKTGLSCRLTCSLLPWPSPEDEWRALHVVHWRQ